MLKLLYHSSLIQLTNVVDMMLILFLLQVLMRLLNVLAVLLLMVTDQHAVSVLSIIDFCHHFIVVPSRRSRIYLIDVNVVPWSGRLVVDVVAVGVSL